MWDRHLRELLYLKQEEKQGRGSGLATTCGLPDVPIHPQLEGCTSQFLEQHGRARPKLWLENRGAGILCLSKEVPEAYEQRRGHQIEFCNGLERQVCNLKTGSGGPLETKPVSQAD